MPNLTLAVPEDLRRTMGQFKEINWSEVARQAIREKARTLQTMNRLLAKSALTDEEIEREARIVKKRVRKKHRR